MTPPFTHPNNCKVDLDMFLMPRGAGSGRSLRQRSSSAITSQPATEDDEMKGIDVSSRAGFRSVLRGSPFLLGPHNFSALDLDDREQTSVVDSSSPDKANLPNHRGTMQSSLMTDSPSGSSIESSLSDVDLENRDRNGVASLIVSSSTKKSRTYQRNYAFTLRSRENIIIHLLMEMKMLQTDLAFILFVTFYQFFHSSVTNLAYWQHARLNAANRVPLKDIAFDLLPPLDGELWIVSEYILYGILIVAISCIVSNLVVNWNAPHGRPIYCMQILRRLGMTWIVCQSFRMISFLVTTLPGASRQCRYAVPDGLTAAEMMSMPAPSEGNPP